MTATPSLDTRHRAGLAAALAVLADCQGDPEASGQRLLRLADAGQADDALVEHARTLLDVDASTTAHLVLPRAAARMLLFTLLVSFEELFTQPVTALLEGDWDTEDAMRRLAEHADAISAMARAWSEDTFRLTHGRRARRPQGSSAPPAGETPVPTPPGQVSPSTVARLQALREEFASDPSGIDLVIDLAGRLATRAAPAPASAAAPFGQVPAAH